MQFHVHIRRMRIGRYGSYVYYNTTECGRVTPAGLLLVVNGTSASYGELPWHAGIYAKGRVYKQICGGSIIKNNVVITGK